MLPLNWDLFTDLVVGLLNTPVFSNFLGTLDAEGAGYARFDTLGPVSPAFSGITLNFAFALDNPWDTVSNAATLHVIP